MKITGPGPVQSKTIKKTSSKKGADSASFSGHISGSGSASAPQTITGKAPISSVDALLALQGVPSSTDGRSKGLMRAEDMLDLLEDVRKDILLGAVSTANLKQLAGLAREQQKDTSDPRLNDILGEIELRAEVELAKYGY